MKRIARIVAVLAVAGLAAPALACELHAPKTTQTPAAAPAVADAKADKAAKKVKVQKVEKAKAPSGERVTAAN